jgi:pyruvate-formate lyase
MNPRIESLLNDVNQKKHHPFRQNIRKGKLIGFTSQLYSKQLTDILRAQQRLTWVLEHETPVILPNEKIVFTRTVREIPELFTPEEWAVIKQDHYIHELGRVCNICPDYEYTIMTGFEQRRIELKQAREYLRLHGKEKEVGYVSSVLKAMRDIENLTERYADLAWALGRSDIHGILSRIPRERAKTFHDALQFFRIIHFSLWASGNYHITIGRFDQYMYKYLKNDLDSGILNEDSAFELLEEFFISFNRDSDLYPGMQQGDNGQSMVLGGVDERGNDAYNMLSEMCLKASLELKLIDPKINLRVHKDTPIEIYDLGSELTRQGLGFPQYSNDDIVIPGLLAKGYEISDARNYVVAACWEFIIPGVGMDIPNITALSFVKVLQTCIKDDLCGSRNFQAFMDGVEKEMGNELIRITANLVNIYTEPAPFMSLLMEGCAKNGLDVMFGARYNNYGIHGTGISTAVDSLAAIRKFVFEEQSVSAPELKEALEKNFEGFECLLHRLQNEAPKMGNDDDLADDIAVELLNIFAKLTENMRNGRNGCFRPGSGSAMYYLWHAGEVGSSADGRRKGEPLAANFSPSLQVKLKGPVSLVHSFSKADMKKIINGGPLTLELHDTIFRNPDSIRKVSHLVKTYMDLGGHQLQINAVNRDRLLAARKHPEQYKNLIVRVWGWSGYFTELDEAFQDHIIQRAELTF